MFRTKITKTDSYNRIFMIGGKDCTEEDLHNLFDKYGKVREIKIVTDKYTKKPKGFNYITYEKPSEAALAIEELNGTVVGENSKGIKLILANDRSEGNVREEGEENKMKRLFIMVPQDLTKEDLEKEFEEFGEIDYVKVLEPKKGKLPLAFVAFKRAYHAALALEGCNPKYRAVFAENMSKPKNDNDDRNAIRRRPSVRDRSPIRPQMPFRDRFDRVEPLFPTEFNRNPMNCYLHSQLCTNLNPRQVHMLFNIFNGMETCNYDPNTGKLTLKYISEWLADQAREKYEGLEYPHGFPIVFNQNSFLDQFQGAGNSHVNQSFNNLSSGMGMVDNHVENNIKQLAQSIQKATAVLQQAGISPRGVSFEPDSICRYTKIELPPPKPILSPDMPPQERLFIVAEPNIIPSHVLVDVFCRFGNFISFHYVPGKKCGYALFGNAESAHELMNTMHKQTIGNCLLKIMIADPPKKGGMGGNGLATNKRQIEVDYMDFGGKYARFE